MLFRVGDGKVQVPLNGEPGCPVPLLATVLLDSHFIAVVVVRAGERGALHWQTQPRRLMFVTFWLPLFPPQLCFTHRKGTAPFQR